MRGKVLALLLAILIATTAFALESGPSNPVGFFTITVSRPSGSSAYNLVSFPTLPADASLNNTIGAQLPGSAISGQATTIYQYNNTGTTAGYATAYRSTSTWSGTGVTSLASNRGYYILLRSNTASLSYNVVVAGDVRTTAWDMGTIQLGFNMIGSVFAAPVTMANTRLWTSPNGGRMFGSSISGQADLVYGLNAAGNLVSVYANASGVWQNAANFTSLEPGKGYFVFRRTAGGRVAFAWNDYPVPTGSSTVSSASSNYTPSFITPATLDRMSKEANDDVAPVRQTKAKSVK